jgi:hypothetical protein
MRLPSGLKAKAVTRPLCSLKIKISLPVSTSHTRDEPSRQAERRRVPFGLKAIHRGPSGARIVRTSSPVFASHSLTVFPRPCTVSFRRKKSVHAAISLPSGEKLTPSPSTFPPDDQHCLSVRRNRHR